MCFHSQFYGKSRVNCIFCFYIKQASAVIVIWKNVGKNFLLVQIDQCTKVRNDHFFSGRVGGGASPTWNLIYIMCSSDQDTNPEFLNLRPKKMERQADCHWDDTKQIFKKPYNKNQKIVFFGSTNIQFTIWKNNFWKHSNLHRGGSTDKLSGKEIRHFFGMWGFQKRILFHPNGNQLTFHMRYRLFLKYGWFFQNLEKDFIQTNMHTTVDCSFPQYKKGGFFCLNQANHKSFVQNEPMCNDEEEKVC